MNTIHIFRIETPHYTFIFINAVFMRAHVTPILPRIHLVSFPRWVCSWHQIFLDGGGKGSQYAYLIQKVRDKLW